MYLRKIRSSVIGIYRRCLQVYWSILLKKKGEGTVIDIGARLFTPENISIGSGCTVNQGAIIQASESADVCIGNDVTLSYDSRIITGSLDLDARLDASRIRERAHTAEAIYIEDGVWIAANVTILAGVRVGERSILAAGCVVIEDVPANVVVAGIPAKVVKQISAP